jgi:hypothetical protein
VGITDYGDTLLRITGLRDYGITGLRWITVDYGDTLLNPQIRLRQQMGDGRGAVIGDLVKCHRNPHVGKNTISAYYSGKDFFTNGQIVRQWLSNQSFQAQGQFGLDTLKRFGQ